MDHDISQCCKLTIYPYLYVAKMLNVNFKLPLHFEKLIMELIETASVFHDVLKDVLVLYRCVF